MRSPPSPFWLPALCAIAFLALFALGIWAPPWFVPPVVLAWTCGLAALTTATVLTTIRAVATRVRGSRVKRIALWVIAKPTVTTALLLALLTPFVNGAEEDFGALLLLSMVSLFGVAVCGLAILLILAALPAQTVEAAPQ